MKKLVIFVIIGMFLLIIIAVILFGVIKTDEGLLDKTMEPKNGTLPMLPEYKWDIIVPDDYSTIQEAIDYANKGDYIFVRNGVYKENILVDKEELFIQGEDKFTTIIDGGKITDAVIISASDVILQGFTITNGWNEDETLWYISGIKILSSNVAIKGNIITLNRLGISTGATASNLIISDNSFIDDGILIGGFEYLKIKKDNFYHTITNNTVNGKTLYYYTDQNDLSVPVDAGQIILVNCTNVIIEDMYLLNTDFSVILCYCSNCIIENIIVEDTDGEIILIDSDNNVIQNNIATHSLHGICLDYKSDNNIVRYNTVSENVIGISVMTSSNTNQVYGNNAHDNGMFGIFVSNQSCDNIVSENEICNNGNIYKNGVGVIILEKSCNNTIQKNNIKQNKRGLVLQGLSNDNAIGYNNFKKNVPVTAAFIGCSGNTWDHNYWNRPRIFPKPIVGLKMVGKIPIPWINIDRHPAKQPYDL